MSLCIVNGYGEGEFQELFCSKCNAYCCRKGVYLPLMEGELEKMTEFARKMQLDIALCMQKIDGKLVWVMSYSKEPCGFLDQITNLCRIYANRPQFCCDYYCEPKVRFPTAFIP